MVGGTDYDNSKFNLAAQGRRQPGSAFKTFVLAAAIETGIDPYNTYYASQPLNSRYPGSTKPWNVKTYGGELLRHHQRRRGHPAQRQHRLRADEPGRGSGAGRRRRQAHGHHLPR